MFHRIPRQRIGTIVAHTRTFVSNVDRGIRMAHHVYKAVKDHVPDSRMKRAAEKGLSDYESVREKIRGASPPL